ncbi:MAG TPA: hypothetical protein VM935_18815, partial [Chitinophagaceae bacterium]|nr:hypothetical protein [Chitinophagaceae bacterium]
DFFWRRPTSMEYELVPDLGKFVLLGKIDFDQLSLESLQKLEYSKNPINSDLLIKGAVVGIITKANRFGKFLVEEDGPEPKIRLVVYARE